MSDFKLSDGIDKNKIFMVNLSEVEGRLDPYFYKNEFKTIEKRINEGIYPAYKLSEMFDINRGGSPRPIQQYITEDKNGLNWIKIGDTKGVDKYIKKVKQKIKPEGAKFSRKVIEGDFILSNSMSFGKPFIMKITGYIHDGWLLFKQKKNVEADKDYLHAVLSSNLIYKMLKRSTIGGVVENLNINLVKNIKIPMPPKKIQKLITKHYEIAYNKKQQKETEAKALLDSIDDYLLNELGIKLPQKDNSLQNRMFKVNLSQISGERFDPDYYSKYYQDIEQEISKCNNLYDIVPISNIVSVIAGGKTPASKEYSKIPTEHPIIKVGSYIDEFIDLKKVDFTIFPNYLQAQQGDIFILSAAHQAEYVGRHIKYLTKKPSIPTSYVGELICVRTIKEKCNSMYLFSLLNTEQYKILLNREKTGQTSHIYGKDIKKIKIPLPDIKVQNEISEHISNIRKQAKQLQKEAKEILENAKIEVEKMILGEK